ncbi:MAG: hypothetical protein WCK10_03770 [Candidatus Staskawiczbacteria bacterium]
MLNFSEVKKSLIYSLIGSLVLAAIVAVITVLTGSYNEVTQKVYMTLFVAVIHSLVSLLFVWDDSRKDTYNRLSFFINTIFILIVASFITSIFGIWKLFIAETIWHLYQTYFLIAVASLHGNILSKAYGKEKMIDGIIYANYLFIGIVVVLFLPVIFINDAVTVLGEMYFRFLAASGIIDGTLGILTIIFYKLYLNKHPEAKVPGTGSGFSIWVWLLLIFLFFQVLVPMFFSFAGLFW